MSDHSTIRIHKCKGDGSLRKTITSIAVFFLVVMVLAACGNETEKAVKGGKVIDLKPKETEAFDKDKTGFIYAQASVSTGLEKDKTIMRELKRAAEKNKIDIYAFDQYKHKQFIDLDIDDHELSFYKDGTKQEGLDLSREKDQEEIAKQIKQFIENVKYDYMQ